MALLIPLHGIGGRGDLPVPLWLAVYSAAAAVAVSFLALAAFWSRPRFELTAGTPVSWLTWIVDARATRWFLKVIGLAALALLLGSAWFGSSSPSLNPAPTWLCVWIWVGTIPLSLLFGPIWRLANPLRTLAAFVSRKTYRDLPDGIAYWPAVAGLAGFLWLELAYPDGSEPLVVAIFVTTCTLVNVAAGIVYGPRWFAIGDSFEVYAEVLAKLSPIGRDDQRRLVLRNPLAGLATIPQEPGIVGLLCLLLGSTAFDGISRWSAWTNLTGELSRTGHIAVHTAGLLAAVALVSGLFVLAARATGTARVRAGAVGNAGLPGAFVHSLVPIAIGYAVAHYFSFAMFQGQEGVLLATDPLGRGWDLLGIGDARIDYAFLGTGLIAGVQIGAIVLGHLTGVVSAHDRAAGLFRRRQLRRAQYPMLAAMVAFTAGGIALVTAS
ncbi:hypothetical protein EV644_101383 [Kribbella orskensis]|uniref:Fenitrothion hydrolase n=1 Tax=Kribbella orskensis TaxID=2512216 RepID=A0ABY2BTY3_9ACTN|nr:MULTISPECIES: hypothetical protein [Kribbella]TCN44481.1 hypothetical protein EV642_101606 [Kribbella sp. VKM Ac-2500]TCO31741.1 hypothetical protein EV644_101383 [Kribbella orskensis]